MRHTNTNTNSTITYNNNCNVLVHTPVLFFPPFLSLPPNPYFPPSIPLSLSICLSPLSCCLVTAKRNLDLNSDEALNNKADERSLSLRRTGRREEFLSLSLCFTPMSIFVSLSPEWTSEKAIWGVGQTERGRMTVGGG